MKVDQGSNAMNLSTNEDNPPRIRNVGSACGSETTNEASADLLFNKKFNSITNLNGFQQVVTPATHFICDSAEINIFNR